MLPMHAGGKLGAALALAVRVFAAGALAGLSNGSPERAPANAHLSRVT